MRHLIFLPSCILTLVLLYLPNPSVSENPASRMPIGERIQGKMIVISEDGIEPKILSMKRADRVAFFVNNSLDSLLSITVQFGKNSTHCASANLEIQDNGIDRDGTHANSVVRSTKPISPKDFATTCFHEPGTYPYTIRGLTSKNAKVGQKPLELHGSIIVE